MNLKNGFVIILTVILALGLVTSSLLSTTPGLRPAEGQAGLTREMRNWEYINHNKLGTNYNPQNIINKDNVQHLELKWIYPIPSASQLGGANFIGFGNVAEGLMAPPLVVDGILYTILNRKTVIALDVGSGDVIWTTEHPGGNNDLNSVSNGGRLPIRPDGTHTHGMNYVDGLLWFQDFACGQTALDANTGERVREFKDLCLEIPLDSPNGMGLPGNSGLYAGSGTHPPMFFENLIFYSQGGASEGTWGGRLYISARDSTSGELAWRTYLMPPCGDPTTCGPGLDGPLFLEEKAAWGQMLVDNCDKIWIQQIKACELDQGLLRNDWGDMRSNAGISNIWGQMVVDEETGILYLGTAQPGPDWNATYTPGFRLFGSAVLAFDARTGDMIWAHQTTARDLWDYDCSWNTILTETMVNGQMEKVVIKGCKNGIVYVFDAATGEALQMLEPPSVKRTPNAEFLDPRSIADMTKPWQHWPETGTTIQNCPGVGCLESDIGFDPVRNVVYFATMNSPQWSVFTNVDNRGEFGLRFGAPAPDWFRPSNPVNYTLNAFNVNTGELVWEYFVDDIGFRGGVMVSGGVVWFSATDGWQRGLNADTGEVLYELNLGGRTSVQPSMGADSDGNMYVLRVLGGPNFNFGNDAPGAIMAYGLPDGLEAQLAAEEAERAAERVALEAEIAAVERAAAAARAEAEAVRAALQEDLEAAEAGRAAERVALEAEIEAEREAAAVELEAASGVISPISYVVIGVGVVLVVIAGVLFTRKRTT